MRGRLTIRAGMAAVMGAGALLAVGGMARAAGVGSSGAGTDILRSAVFHGDAASLVPPAETRIKIIIRSADGSEETRLVTRAELDGMTGSAAPPPPAPAARSKPLPAPSLAASIVATRATASRTRTAAAAWVALDRDALEAATHVTDDADIASPVVVRAAGGASGTRRKEGRTVLGVRDGRGFRDQGRLYIYAAGKGAGVGMNITDQGTGAGWSGSGMSYDRNGFAGQRSAGVGWRQGDLSTSVGWVHAKTNVVGTGIFRAPAEKDDRVALTVSWRPSPR